MITSWQGRIGSHVSDIWDPNTFTDYIDGRAKSDKYSMYTNTNIIIFQVVSVDKYNYRSMEGRGELLGPVRGSSPIFKGQAGAGFINGRKL